MAMLRRWHLTCLFALLALAAIASRSESGFPPRQEQQSEGGAGPFIEQLSVSSRHQSRFEDKHRHCASSSITRTSSNRERQYPLYDGVCASTDASDILNALINATETLQSHYFQVWQGTWPTSIDWTAAVLGTHLSATLASLSTSLSFLPSAFCGNVACADPKMDDYDNLTNAFFTQLMSFYFGQDAFSLRTQAYDDMLWVVLGWLETIKFIMLHSSLRYDSSDGKTSRKIRWYGNQFVPALAHRARIFYDLASRGWDTTLCGGGMLWNPYLKPYKNAITNELFIAASIGMYLYFPGDSNSSPFVGQAKLPPAKAHDPKFLDAALKAYSWLSQSNMTNSRGLYVDGFHISDNGRENDTNRNKNCDQRNEMVYTYNQGVLLSGLRGLWESTGSISYLEEGHALIGSVIKGTGWDGFQESGHDVGLWAGLGRNGVLEEFCDSSGSCSQDAQTFKGIFFHHLANFCVALPTTALTPGRTYAASSKVQQAHRDRCASYAPWVLHNAQAARVTINDKGLFGMCWGRPYGDSSAEADEHVPLPEGAIDYRNPESTKLQRDSSDRHTIPRPREGDRGSISQSASVKDVNDRGRGRTAETQAGGLAVLRAALEIEKLRHLPFYE